MLLGSMIIGCKEYLGQPIACDFGQTMNNIAVAEQVCMKRGKSQDIYLIGNS